MINYDINVWLVNIIISHLYSLGDIYGGLKQMLLFYIVRMFWQFFDDLRKRETNMHYNIRVYVSLLYGEYSKLSLLYGEK